MKRRLTGISERDVMKLPRRIFLQLAAGTAALSAISRVARAQTYPTRIVIGNFSPVRSMACPGEIVKLRRV
jgi:hypothetical protein